MVTLCDCTEIRTNAMCLCVYHITITLSPARFAHSLGSLGTLKEPAGPFSAHVCWVANTRAFTFRHRAGMAVRLEGVTWKLKEWLRLWKFPSSGCSSAEASFTQAATLAANDALEKFTTNSPQALHFVGGFSFSVSYWRAVGVCGVTTL